VLADQSVLQAQHVSLADREASAGRRDAEGGALSTGSSTGSRAHARSAAIYLAIRQAAAVDTEAAELEQTLADQRFSGHREAAHELARGKDLRPGLTLDHAAAAIWTLGHSDTHRFLCQRRGWSALPYSRWLTDELYAALLPPRPPI
jgi:hypothetical protein